KVLASATGLGDKPTMQDMLGVINAVTTSYEQGETDRVYLVSSKFVNTMTQQAEIEQLLPAKAPEGEMTTEGGFGWDYIYEPSAPELMDTVVQRYVESLVYTAVVENAACEQSARMVAMKAASDNAGKIIDDLQLAYNKARQANITKELAEIVGGAAAIE
ncbi:MAG: F0F1 ATP synthase subunit gamma, partial [Algiphilus sp.]